MDDFLFVYAVGHRQLCFIGRCNTPVLAASEADIAERPERQRWGHWVKAINKTRELGRAWAKHDIKLFDLVERHNATWPAHSFTTGSLNYGRDLLWWRSRYWPGRTAPLSPIIVAVSDTVRHHVVGLCQQRRCAVVVPTSPSEALALLVRRPLRGVIVDEREVVDAKVRLAHFIDAARRDAVASVALIRRVYPVFDLLYHPPLHQVLTFPFNPDELGAMMRRATMLRL